MTIKILHGDVTDRLRELEENSFDCVVTSPPYWGLRDYGIAGQLGCEPTLGEHVEKMVGIFREIRRVLKPSGVCWVNYGDCYAAAPNGWAAQRYKDEGTDDRTHRDKPFSTIGPVHAPSTQDPFRRDMGRRGGGQNVEATLKPKDLCMVPERFALAMQADGWWIRSRLPWLKRNAMPESTRDRPSSAIEYVFMFTKSLRYHYDAAAVRRPMTDVSINRLTQPNVFDQEGGEKDGINPNRSFKKVRNNTAERLRKGENWKSRHEGWKEKQRGHGRRHQGFNDRWDSMSKEEQQASGRNFRNTDLFYDSILKPLYLITDEDGLPIALDVPPQPFKEAHFATFPPALIEPLIKATCPVGGTVFDPFGGAGTTGLVADRLQRNAVLIEINPAYIDIARKRLADEGGMLTSVEVVT